MSACDADQPPKDPDLLAAAYVIGLLTTEEMHEVEAEAVVNPSLAASIMGWQAWLHPMTEAVPPVPPPPDVWQRLQATIGLVRAPEPVSPRRRWRWGSASAWRGALAGAVCTTIIGGAILGPKLWTSAPEIGALLSPDDADPAYKVEMTPDGIATVVAINPNAGSDRSLQLWTLDGATPVSLGLLPLRGRFQVQRKLVPGAKLLVSEEPKGGSKTGSPTGPVVYQGRLIRG